MKRRRTSLPAWGSCFAVLVLVAQVGLPGAIAPVSGSLGGSGRSLGNLRSAQVEDVTSNGIALVGPEAIQVRPADEDQANAFNAALELAYAHREDLGYPWLDSASGVLELSFATGLGETVAAGAVDGLSAGGRTVRLRPAPASIAELDALADAVTRLNAAGVPGADRIWMTEPDQKNNRIIVTVSDAPDEPHTSTASAVDGMASRWSQIGDAACVNGHVTGEWCGMVTAHGREHPLHLRWHQCLGEACQHRAGRRQHLPDQGGLRRAPVYRRVSSSRIAAVGIHSGSAPLVAACQRVLHRHLGCLLAAFPVRSRPQASPGRDAGWRRPKGSAAARGPRGGRRRGSCRLFAVSDRAEPIEYYRLVGDRTLVVGTTTVRRFTWTRVSSVTETPTSVVVAVRSFRIQFGPAGRPQPTRSNWSSPSRRPSTVGRSSMRAPGRWSERRTASGLRHVDERSGSARQGPPRRSG
ncbi:MAG: hypothetical protein KatS3mg065_0054 [Chloroflexota bacterium]|nr:MAG: hypothetical protein KatS3mg065_0054 [Chloroflexota bacterium]